MGCRLLRNRQNVHMHTPGRMPKGVWREMFKAAAVHANKHPLLSNSNRRAHTEASTHADTFSFIAPVSRHRQPPSVPYASVPANYKRSNQFHHVLHPGNWTPVTPATRRLSRYLTATYTRPQSEPGSSSLPPVQTAGGPSRQGLTGCNTEPADRSTS